MSEFRGFKFVLCELLVDFSWWNNKIKQLGNWKGKTRECKAYNASEGKSGMLLVLYTAPKR